MRRHIGADTEWSPSLGDRDPERGYRVVCLSAPLNRWFGRLPVVLGGPVAYEVALGVRPCAVISFDEMPEGNAQFAVLHVDFLRLVGDMPGSCPVSVTDLMRYLAVEVPGGDRLVEGDLSFLRTALVEGASYRIWSFNEPEDGTGAYATVSRAPDGQQSIGCEDNFYGLTPEQYILGDYHHVF